MPERSLTDRDDEARWDAATWDGARREQMRRWAALPLERAILALEEMEELARELCDSPSPGKQRRG